MRGGATSEPLQLAAKATKNTEILLNDNFYLNEDNRLYFDGKAIPNVIDLKDLFNELLIKFKSSLNINIPIATILPYTGSKLPDLQWKYCDGAILSKKEYSELYEIIGDTYNLSTDIIDNEHFKIPTLVEKFIEGKDPYKKDYSQLYLDAGLPNITGSVNGILAKTNTTFYGAFNNFYTIGGNDEGTHSGSKHSHLSFDASRYNKIYGNSNTVQPNALLMNYIIKCK